MLNVVLVGILFAAVAMVLNSCGALLQAEGARRATRTKPAAIQPRYLAGMLLDLVAWGFAVMALRVLPVFAVQALIGGTIALTAVVSARLIGARLPMATRLAVTGCLAGLVLVAASAGSEQPPVHRPGVDVVLLASLLLLAVGVLVLRQGKHAWPLAVVSGLGFGGGAVSVRAAHVQTGDGRPRTVARPAVDVPRGRVLAGRHGGLHSGAEPRRRRRGHRGLHRDRGARAGNGRNLAAGRPGPARLGLGARVRARGGPRRHRRDREGATAAPAPHQVAVPFRTRQRCFTGNDVCMTWEDVVAIASELPEVEESTSYGTPALKVKGKGFARLRTEAEGGLVLMCGMDEKEALLASGDPAFYTTPHYNGYGAILVDLERVARDQLEELIEEAWRSRAPARLRKTHESG